MKLLVLYHGYGNHGGGEKILFDFLKFSSKYCNINILSINNKKNYSGFKITYIENIKLFYNSRYNISFINIFLNFKYILIYIFKIIKIANEFNPEFIYAHDNLNKCLVPILKIFIKKPFVCHCHDILKGNLIDRYLKFVYKYFFDKIIFPSESALYSAIGSTSHNSRVIRPIPLENFPKYKGEWNNFEFKLLTVGLLDYVKGQDIVIRAIAHLCQTNFPYKIIYSIAGSGVEFTNLKNLVNRLNISENIKFLGYIEDLSPIINQNHAVIIPSRQESFGLSFIEAGLRGIPIIYSDVDALSENAKGFSLIRFNCNDYLSCANSIINMINNYNEQLSVAYNFRLHCSAQQYNTNYPTYNHLFSENLYKD